MLIDCGTCRGHAEGRCADCVVTVMATLPVPRVRPPERGLPADRAAGTTIAPVRTSVADMTTDPQGGGLPLDANERAAVELFVRAGLVDPDEAASLRATPQSWRRHRAVG